MTSGNQQEARVEIVAVAKSMVSGEMPLIEGARRLCDLRHRIGASDSDLFNPIMGFESETDDYPTGSQRQAYSKEALAAMDDEMAAYLTEARPAVVRACNQIIAALGSP